MSFEKLLEYQKIDRELVKIERDLNTSDEKERAAKLNNMLRSAGDCMSQLNTEADELIGSLDKLLVNIDEIEEQIDEIAKHYSVAKELNEIDFYEKKLAALSDDFERQEREISRLSSRIDSVKSNSDHQLKQALQIKEQYNRAMDAYQNLKKKLLAEGAPINAKLKALEAEIEPKLIEIYKRLRQNKKLPAFVEYRNDGSCVCGMNLPNNCVDRLKGSGDMVECPNCGRFLIIK
jgi:Zn-ribbon protein, possibly nucleic acid-binding